MPRNAIFFLNNYNDVDQTAPLILNLLQDAKGVKVVCLSDYQLTQDPRIQLFDGYPSFVIATPKLFSRLTQSPRKILKLVKRILFNTLFGIFFLKHHQIGICMYTWCDPTGKGFQTAVFRAAQFLGIKNICLPHGQNIFLNYDVNAYLKDFHEAKGTWPDFSPRNQFDLYIVQSKHHRNWNMHWGMDPAVIVSLGSLRFNPEWIEEHRTLYKDYENEQFEKFSDRVRLVFFIPHWHYNVDYEAAISLIAELVESKLAVSVIKGHTRGHGIAQADFSDLSRHLCIHIDSNTPSTPLIDWADVVINFGSSIGLEAIVKDRTVINPRFLHENRTVFDNSGAVYDAFSNGDVLEILRQFRNAELPKIDRHARKRLLNSEIFNGYFGSSSVEQYRAIYDRYLVGRS